MSEPKLISPLLNNFDMGDPISEHDGVRCCPAMEKNSDKKYIVKVISIPASKVKLDALLLTGAFPNKEAAGEYFKELADDVATEASVLQKISGLEGFLPYLSWQIEPMDGETGYDVYLLSEYRTTLARHFRKKPMTHLAAVNLGLDLCAALAVSRHSGYLYVDLKPNNIYICGDSEYRIGDLGFIKLSGLKYTSLPEKYRSQYTAPEITDAFSALNTTIDIYAVGLILYQAYNDGVLPFKDSQAPAEAFPAPAYADYEMSEIILKACAPNPEDRWQDPIQMGQAIVSYMQRNGANNTPIVPVSIEKDDPEDSVDVDDFKEECIDVSESEAPLTASTELSSEPAADPILTTEEAAALLILTGADADSPDPDAIDALEEDDTVSAPVITGVPVSDDELSNLTDSLVNILQDSESEDSMDDLLKDIAAAEEAEETTDTSNIYKEDALGNLTFLLEAAIDETAPDNQDSDIPYEEVSDEVSEILSYADELISHPTPEPVVAPDPVDIPMPEPLPVVSEQEQAPAEADPEDSPEADNSSSQDSVAVAEPDEVVSDQYSDVSPAKKSLKNWILGFIIVILMAGIAFVGFYIYQNYYLQPATLNLSGTEKTLTVYVDAKVDESKLTVFCSDTYGNRLMSPVVNGKAEFTNLAPGAGYTVTVEVTGFHRLTGNTSTAYSTPVQTNVVQMSAITGQENGSVILSFAIDGPDSPQWTMVCSADGEEEKSVDFSGHMVTVNGLAPDKEYTFTLTSKNNVYISGNNQLSWYVSNVIRAEDLQITSLNENKLTVTWNTPAGETVESWTVRCYNDDKYNETITTAETTAVFDGVDQTSDYTVEVTAANMSSGERVYIGSNSVTITDFSVDTTNPAKLVLQWQSNQPLAEGEWILIYTVNGTQVQESVNARGTQAEIVPAIPNANYSFTLTNTMGSHVFNDTYSHSTAESATFANYDVTAAHMEFNMCKTPSTPNWDRFALSAEDYRTAFMIGEKASFLVRMRKSYNISYDEILTLFVIRNKSGDIVCTSTSTETWISMWYQNYCELDIPELPVEIGEYTISVYFNGYLAGSQDFAIVSADNTVLNQS